MFATFFYQNKIQYEIRVYKHRHYSDHKVKNSLFYHLYVICVLTLVHELSTFIFSNVTETDGAGSPVELSKI